MNKSEAIDELIKKIYNENSDLIVNEVDIKKLNEFFRSSMEYEEQFEDFFEQNKQELNEISKLKSGKYEMEKQYKEGKALQPGILSECNYVETLAKIFNLNKCLDFDRTPINKIPLECRQYLNSGYQTFSAARYLYYNPKNISIFIFQYGNPANGDAEIIIDGNKVRLEFKERNAKTGEYDITGLYDENGKLLISDDFRNKTPEYIPFIEKFNNETNVIDYIGHNYSNFDEETKILSIMEYFTRHDIDAIVSSTSDNELIILTPECIQVELPDGRKIITTENSEIRTSGRNQTKIFTMEYFKKVLTLMNAEKIDEMHYKVNINNQYVEKATGRGTNKLSRIKFNKVFYIDIDQAILDDNYVIFDISNVKQLKPSISMHIKINANKQQLKEYYDVKFNGGEIDNE